MQPTASFTQNTSDIDSLLYNEFNLNASKGTIPSGTAALKRGTVMGKKTVGAVTAAAKGGGNTGNGTCTLLSAGKNAKVGVYKAILAIGDVSYTDSGNDTISTQNAATWNLYDPDGKLIDQKQYSGAGATAVFANDQIHATVTDGNTDFIIGDEFDITVAAGTGKWIKSVATAVDGSQFPTAILALDADASAADVEGLLYTAGNFVASELIYDASFATLAALQAALPVSVQVYLDGPT